MTRVEAGALTGRLVDRGLWWEVADLSGPPDRAWVDAAVAVAAAAGALGLRVAVGDAAWGTLGLRPLAADDPAELQLPVTLRLDGVAQTRALGERLAAELRPGDLVVLSGPLGAGKTALTQGIGAGLGVRGAVTSPTFVLAREHRGPVPLLHVDAYRVRDTAVGASALADLDLEAALEVGVVVVEWGRGLAEDVADAWLDVELGRHQVGQQVGQPDGGPGAAERRSLRVVAHGPRWSVVGRPGC